MPSPPRPSATASTPPREDLLAALDPEVARAVEALVMLHHDVGDPIFEGDGCEKWHSRPESAPSPSRTPSRGDGPACSESRRDGDLADSCTSAAERQCLNDPLRTIRGALATRQASSATRRSCRGGVGIAHLDGRPRAARAPASTALEAFGAFEEGSGRTSLLGDILYEAEQSRSSRVEVGVVHERWSSPSKMPPSLPTIAALVIRQPPSALRASSTSRLIFLGSS